MTSLTKYRNTHLGETEPWHLENFLDQSILLLDFVLSFLTPAIHQFLHNFRAFRASLLHVMIYYLTAEHHEFIPLSLPNNVDHFTI
jgi:hypothetical protein